MAKLYLKHAYEFENPSRRIFKEGGELFKGESSQAKEIKDWTAEAEKTRKLATDVENQAEAIRKGTNRDLLELYVDLFNSFTIPNQESVDSDKPGEINVKDHPEYKGKGLLEIIEKECGAMRMAFNNPSNGTDLRLLSYATVYNNFQKKFGVNANVIPFESSVITVENGIVRISFYDEKQKKTITAESELFPWDSAKVAQAKLLEIQAAERAEEARRIDETGRPQESTELREILAEGTSTHEAVLRLQEQAKILEDQARELGKVNAEYIQFLTMPGGLNEQARVAAVDVRKNIFFGGRELAQTTESMQALSTKLKAQSDLSDEDKLVLDSVDAILTYGKNSANLIMGEAEVFDVEKRKELLAADWAVMRQTFELMMAKRGPGVSMTTKFPKGEEDPSREITFKNDASGVTYTLTVDVPTSLEDMPFLYTDPDVKVVVVDGAGTTLPTPKEADGDDIYSLGAYYMERTYESKGVAAEVEVSEEKAEKKLSPKRTMEAEIDALFVDFNGSPESWQKVDAQYKKMRTELPQGRIRALDHYRGSEAAARAGRIDEAIALLDLAAKNAGDGTYEKADAVANQESLRKKYGIISLNERTQRYFTYTSAPGAAVNDYDAAALEYAKTEFQKNGRFEGRVPLGMYEVGGTKVYTVTAEGTTVKDKTAPEATPTVAEAAPTAPAEVVSDEKALKQKAQLAADSLKLSTFMGPESVAQGLKGYRQRAGNEAYWFTSQFQDGDFSYVSMEDRHLPEPNMDGSVEWSVDFRTVEGDTFRVTAEAKAVDMAQVKAYREAQLARGINYPEEDLIAYLAYRTVSQEFKINIEETRNNVALNKKYMAYLAANRPEVAEGYVPPTEVPVLDLDEEEGNEFVSELSMFPGMPQADYKIIGPEAFIIQDSVEGPVTIKWENRQAFQGEIKNNVPNGLGALRLEDGQLLGPVQFVDGKATVEAPDGKKKEINWDTELSCFEVRDR